MRTFLVLTALLAFLFFMPHVQAIGISPVYREVFFEPGYEKNFTFIIIGAPKRPLVVKPYVNGTPAEYAIVPERTYYIGAKDSHAFTIGLKLPQEMEPGKHKLYVGVMEQASSSDDGIFARIGVESIIEVRVPYPAKYIEFTTRCQDTDIGDTATFRSTVTNYGTKDLEDVSSKFEIFSSEDTRVADLETNEGSVFLATRQEATFSSSWETEGNNPGEYLAVTTVNYDGKTTSGACKFRLGELHIDIENLEINDTVQGDIAKFVATIQSLWNSGLPQVFSEITIYDEDGNEVGSSAGETIRVGKWGSRELTIYWDTGSNPVGDYEAELFLDYDGSNTTSRRVAFSITQPLEISWVHVLLIVMVIIIVYQVVSRRRK